MINKTYTVRLYREITQQAIVTISSKDIKEALDIAPKRYAKTAIQYLAEKTTSETKEDKTGLSLPKYEWTTFKINDEIEFEKYKIEEILEDFSKRKRCKDDL
jgi:hypothetical protein